MVRAYAGAHFQADSLQTLNLSSSLGGGLGFHLIKSERTSLDLLGGLNSTRENYDAFTRKFAAATIGERTCPQASSEHLPDAKALFLPKHK